MKIGRVKHYVLRDYQTEGRMSDVEDFTNPPDREWYENYIAVFSLLPHPDGRLLCGVTAPDTDILHRFDTETKQFESLRYPKVSEPHEIKIHRMLDLASDGTVYGASACLFRSGRIQETYQTSDRTFLSFSPVRGNWPFLLPAESRAASTW